VWRDVRAGVRAVQEGIEGFRVDVADLNWRRLAGVRDALRHVTRNAAVDHLRDTRLKIAYAPGEAALGWLLGGWIAAQLRLAPETAPQVDERSDLNAIVTLSVGDAPVPLVAATEDEVRVTPPSAPPYVKGVRRESRADAIAAELRSLSTDAALRNTIRALVRLTSAASS